MKKSIITSLALSFMICSCQNVISDVADSQENERISVTLSVDEFEFVSKPETATRTSPTRSEGEMLYPVFVYVADTDGDDDLTLVATLNSDKQFSFSIGNGNYELFAICGLPKEVQPKTKTDLINIPAATTGMSGLTDFAVGEIEIAVKNGTYTPNKLNIVSKRMLAWIDLTLTDIPSNINKVRLYAKGLCERFSLSEKWEGTDKVDKHYMEIPVSYDSNNNVFSGNALLPPSHNDKQLTIVAVITTTSSQTKIMAGTVNTSLSPSTHLSLEMKFGDLILIDDEIADIEEWIHKSETASLDTEFSFGIGDQYFNDAATVYYCADEYIRIFPHVAEEKTREEINSLSQEAFNNYSYTLLPKIPASVWIIPTSDVHPKAVLSAINKIGWDEFCKQFEISGNTPISRTAKNVLAYYDIPNQRFFCCDFENLGIVEAADDVTTFQIFPLGTIPLFK